MFSNNRNGVNEPSKKRTRFETDKQRQERLAQEKTRRKEHQVRKTPYIIFYINYII